jgi:hypothetical protein
MTNNNYGSTMSNVRDTQITMIQNEISFFNICQLSAEIIDMKNKNRQKFINNLNNLIGQSISK